MVYLSIFLGGFVGTIARYSIGKRVGRFWQTPFPLGTFIINITGSFILGFLLTIFALRSNVPVPIQTGLAVGFTGSYTTFSAFSYETVKLLEKGEWIYLSMYIMFSLFLALLMVVLGMTVATMM